METSKKCLLAAIVILTSALLSWNHISDSNTDSDIISSSNESYLTDPETATFESEEEYLPDTNQVPAAEDVLVQKIPGDNNHLLLMAFYSRENYSGPSITLFDGSGLLFRDDGKGFDKKAGDGLYTTRITADVREFRRQAVDMNAQMKKRNFKPFRYVHRMMVYDPDVAENFDIQKFDANETVSISSLTDALSTDITPVSNSGTLSTTSTLNSTNTLSSTNISNSSTSAAVDLIRKNCMLITDTLVVEDTTRTWNFCKQRGNVNGSWTFGTLMRQLASKSPTASATDAQVSDFVKNWLKTWTTKQVINGDTVAARTLMNSVLTPWLTKSSNAGAPSGQLDMKFAPFKLLAIINRFDLRDGALNGLPGSPCGEGRFLFCLIKDDCSRAVSMTVIFEYGINKPATCSDQKAWAQQWLDLKDFTIGSSSYNQALQNITDQFTLCGTNPNKPNQSSLDQLRTNDVALSPSPKTWELRQFSIDSATGSLKEEAVGQTPTDKYNARIVNADVQRMVDYVNKNRSTINKETNIVPLTWNGFPFLGGSSHILDSPTGQPPKVYHWDGTDSTNKLTFITDNNSRFFFSFNTCSGCHSGETQTHFTHVDPVFFGTQATLSGMLTGTAGSGNAIDFDNNPNNDTMAIKDAALRPSSNPKIRNFNEIKRRALDLKKVTSTTCSTVLSISTELMFQPLNSVD